MLWTKHCLPMVAHCTCYGGKVREKVACNFLQSDSWLLRRSFDLCGLCLLPSANLNEGRASANADLLLRLPYAIVGSQSPAKSFN